MPHTLINKAGVPVVFEFKKVVRGVRHEKHLVRFRQIGPAGVDIFPQRPIGRLTTPIMRHERILVGKGNAEMTRIHFHIGGDLIRGEMADDLMVEKLERDAILITARPLGADDFGIKEFREIEIVGRNGEMKYDHSLRLCQLDWRCAVR